MYGLRLNPKLFLTKLLKFMKNQFYKCFMLALLSGVLISCNSMLEEFPTQNENADKQEGYELSELNADESNLRRGNSMTYGAFLTGTEEVPPVDASGAGSSRFEIIDNGKAIKFEIRVANTEGIIFAHIHKGAFGTNGPVMVTLIPNQAPSGLVNDVIAEGVLTAADLEGDFASDNLNGLIDALNTGMAYVNVHTDKNRPGELRGQISAIRPNDNGNFTTQLTGDQEVHEVQTRARGVANFRYSSDNGTLDFQVNVANLEDVRFAHIHLGKRGVNGPIIVTLKSEKMEGRVNGVYAKGVLTSSDLEGKLIGGDLVILREAFRTGNAYVNVHTDKFPPGELRGQL